jgi:hypothetical protein
MVLMVEKIVESNAIRFSRKLQIMRRIIQSVEE